LARKQVFTIDEAEKASSMPSIMLNLSSVFLLFKKDISSIYVIILLMSVKPRYWGTNKGEVLKAIVMGERRTWNEIYDKTGFTREELNQVLSDLFITDIISKSNRSYWIDDYDLYCEYRDFLQGNSESEYLTKEHQEKSEQFMIHRENLEKINDYIADNEIGKTVVEKILWWTYREKNLLSLDAEHCFIEGDLLDRLSKDLIDYSKEKVIVINPFVDQCSLSDKLKDATSQGKNVILITRSPLSESSTRVRSSRKKYHNVLAQSGVDLHYNDRIHSKILLLDNLVSIVSSLNFKSESSSGKNLEAGIVSWEKNMINSLTKYIENLLQDYETTNYTG